MNGPVLSGGVIVLVAAALWMLYLLPSWRGRHQYYAAERNAVRMNQALRVLAETSEVPEEVRLELNTRTALQQQKLAKRVQQAKKETELARLKEELASTLQNPQLKRARARRRVRLAGSAVAVLGVIMAALGIWQGLAVGSWALSVVGGVAVLAGGGVLVRMSQVARRSTSRVSVPETAPAVSEQRVSPPLHDQGPATWTPRSLPQPMARVAGSRAQAAQAVQDAQEARRQAARSEELRKRAEEIARPEPVELAPSAYARMGYVDDAEIEDHVRKLLERRAAG